MVEVGEVNERLIICIEGGKQWYNTGREERGQGSGIEWQGTRTGGTWRER